MESPNYKLKEDLKRLEAAFGARSNESKQSEVPKTHTAIRTKKQISKKLSSFRIFNTLQLQKFALALSSKMKKVAIPRKVRTRSRSENVETNYAEKKVAQDLKSHKLRRYSCQCKACKRRMHIGDFVAIEEPKPEPRKLVKAEAINIAQYFPIENEKKVQESPGVPTIREMRMQMKKALSKALDKRLGPMLNESRNIQRAAKTMPEKYYAVQDNYDSARSQKIPAWGQIVKGRAKIKELIHSQPKVSTSRLQKKKKPETVRRGYTDRPSSKSSFLKRLLEVHSNLLVYTLRQTTHNRNSPANDRSRANQQLAQMQSAPVLSMRKQAKGAVKKVDKRPGKQGIKLPTLKHIEFYL